VRKTRLPDQNACCIKTYPIGWASGALRRVEYSRTRGAASGADGHRTTRWLTSACDPGRHQIHPAPITAAAPDQAPAPSGAPWLARIAFGAILALKLALLAAYGPIYTPDSGGYVAYAQAMRASTAWLHDAGLAQSAVPVLALRMAGYPAVIAGAMALVGAAWPVAVVLVQFALSMTAGHALYRLAAELGLSARTALAAAVVYMLSLPLTYDQCILTDSLYASLIVLATAALTHGVLAKRTFSWRQGAVAGALFVLAFLLRDSTLVLLLAFVPLIALRAWLNGAARWRQSAVAVLLLVLPLLASAELYKRWNEYRSGERFVTTVAQLTVVHGLAKTAASNPQLLSGDTPLDRVGARLFRGDPFGESVKVSNELFAQGYAATDIARMAFGVYFRSWRAHPAAMLHLLKRNTSERVAKLTIRPIAAICETSELAAGERRCYDYRTLYRAIPSGFAGLPRSAVAFFALQTLELTLAICLFALFFLGVPAMLAQATLASGGRPDRAILTFGAFWAVYVLWHLAHAIVHMEDRYMMPVLPLSILAGLFVAVALHRRRKARTRSHATSSA